MRARSGEAWSLRVPSGWILLRKWRKNSLKSRIPRDRESTWRHSERMAAGGSREISRHWAARSTTRITSRISVVCKATPAMRAFSTSGPMPDRPKKSKCPPTRRNSRISVARFCSVSIQLRSVEGANPATRDWPSGEEQYAPRSSRRASNSRTRAELSRSLPGMAGFMLQEGRCLGIGFHSRFP